MHELVDLEGFGDVVQETGLEGPFDVIRYRIGAERNDGDMRRRCISAQDFQRFDPADARQVDVHQDHRRLMGARRFNAQMGVRRGEQAQVGAARNNFPEAD